MLVNLINNIISLTFISKVPMMIQHMIRDDIFSANQNSSQ